MSENNSSFPLDITASNKNADINLNSSGKGPPIQGENSNEFKNRKSMDRRKGPEENEKSFKRPIDSESSLRTLERTIETRLDYERTLNEQIEPFVILSDALNTLGNKYRLMILLNLKEQEMTFTDLVSKLSVNTNTMNFHLKKLLGHRFIERSNKKYSITETGIIALDVAGLLLGVLENGLNTNFKVSKLKNHKR